MLFGAKAAPAKEAVKTQDDLRSMLTANAVPADDAIEIIDDAIEIEDEAIAVSKTAPVASSK